MTSAPSSTRRRILAAVSILAAVAALAFIASKVDWSATAGVIRRAGWAATAAFVGLCAGTIFLQTLGWWVLLRARGWKIPLRTAAASMLMGNAAAYVTPSMYLGGEPLRIWHIGTRFQLQKREVAATVIVHKFAEFAGFIVALLVCTGTMLWRFDVSPAVRVGSTVASGVLFVVFLTLALAFVGRWPLASGVMRLSGKRGESLRAKTVEMEGHIETTFRDHRGSFFASLLLTGGPLALVVAKPLAFFAFLGRPLSFPELALVFVCSQILLAFQITPGSLGVLEGGLIGTFALIGIGAPEAVAYAAMQRLADTVLVGSGIALAGHEGLSGFLRGRSPEGSGSERGGPPR
ncbi:MAG: flippase-like domain-containing protein [Planctomycetes bacterium]|nr:flippase-like domain-containing protein [Planctomycetota bacterium]